MIYNVRFYGGPMDGLAVGWNVDIELPDEVTVSPELGHKRGGIRMEVTSPEACGVLREDEQAKDEVLYIQCEPGSYFYDRDGRS